MQSLVVFAALVVVAAAAPQFNLAGNSDFHKLSSTFTSETAAKPFALGQSGLSSFRQESGRSLLQPTLLVKKTEHHFIQEPSVLLHKELHSTRQLASQEGAAQVEEQVFEMPEPGRYSYHFKTNNGIQMVEEAAPEGEAEKVHGEFMWTSPEGKAFKIEYVADEFGFHPTGEHLPVAPAIPADIQRSIEWNVAHPDEEARKWDSEEYVMPARPFAAKSFFAKN